MKKLVFSIALLMGLNFSTYGAVYSIYSYSAKTSLGTKAFIWEYLYDTSNVTYNSQSGHGVTNATHSGEGNLLVLVYADTHSEITDLPIVGASTHEPVLLATEDRYDGSYAVRMYLYYDQGDVSGKFNSFYSYGNTVLKSTDRWLRYPWLIYNSKNFSYYYFSNYF